MSESPTRRWALWGCLLLAIVQLAYLAETLTLPFVEGPLYDSVVYLAQAESVAAGQHGAAPLLAFSPLYGYLLALVNAQTSPISAILLQFLLGAAALGLTYRIARQWFDAPWAWGAVAVQAGYGLLLFYQGKLLSETLGVVLALGAYALFTAPRFRRGHLATALAAGLVLGLAVMARTSLLFTLPFFGLAALLPWQRAAAPLRARLIRTAGLTLGVLLIVGARGAVSQASAGVFVPFIMVSSTVDHATSQGGWTGQLDATVGHRASAWDVVREAQRQLESGEAQGARAPNIDLVGWLRGTPPKLWRTLGDLETGFMYGYYGERSESHTLGILPITFHVILLLALAGGALLVQRAGWRALLPIAPLILGALITTTLFHPSSRYRLPMVLALLPLTAGGLRWLAEWPSHRWGQGLRVGLIALCVVSMGRTYTYRLRHPASWHLEVARSAVQAGDWQTVRARARLALATAGDDAASIRIAQRLLAHRP
jgi:hypothetical protein